MKVAFLTRTHDDHALLNLGIDVEDQEGAMAGCLAILRGDRDVLFVEVFQAIPSAPGRGYQSWFRMGRDVESVQGPKAPRATEAPREGVN